MGINFNIVKKPTKKEVEEEVDEIAADEEIEDELEEDDQPSKPAFDPKKRMIIGDALKHEWFKKFVKKK